MICVHSCYCTSWELIRIIVDLVLARNITHSFLAFSRSLWMVHISLIKLGMAVTTIGIINI